MQWQRRASADAAATAAITTFYTECARGRFNEAATLQQWLRRIPEFSLANEQPAGSVFGGSVMGFTALRLQWEVAAEPAAA